MRSSQSRSSPAPDAGTLCKVGTRPFEMISFFRSPGRRCCKGGGRGWGGGGERGPFFCAQGCRHATRGLRGDARHHERPACRLGFVSFSFKISKKGAAGCRPYHLPCGQSGASSGSPEKLLPGTLPGRLASTVSALPCGGAQPGGEVRRPQPRAPGCGPVGADQALELWEERGRKRPIHADPPSIRTHPGLISAACGCF